MGIYEHSCIQHEFPRIIHKFNQKLSTNLRARQVYLDYAELQPVICNPTSPSNFIFFK